MDRLEKLDEFLAQNKDYLQKIVIGVILTFIILRFINLLADPPTEELLITRSNPFLSDEGWWLNNAIHKILTGEWYIEGGYNSGVILPVVPFIQYITFSIFGMGLVQARIVAILFFAGGSLLLYLICEKYSDKLTSLIIVALLVQNFYLFIYSRFTFLFPFLMFFVALPIFIATLEKGNQYLIFGLSAFAVVIACLVKTSALFVFPIIIFMAYDRGEKFKDKIYLILEVVVIFGLFYGGYQLFLRHYFPADYNTFYGTNVGGKQIGSLGSYISNFRGLITNFKQISSWIYPVVLSLSISFFIIFKKFRNNRLNKIALVWIFSYLALLLSVNEYNTRYYLLFLPPMFTLFIQIIKYLYKNTELSNYLLTLLFVLWISTAYNGYKIGDYLKNSKFEWKQIIQQADSLISANSSDPVVIGNIAQTLSLETGIKSVIPDPRLTTKELEWILEKHQPDYYFGNTGFTNWRMRSDIFEYYDVEQVKEWEMNNLILFKLNSKSDSTDG